MRVSHKKNKRIEKKKNLFLFVFPSSSKTPSLDSNPLAKGDTKCCEVDSSIHVIAAFSKESV